MHNEALAQAEKDRAKIQQVVDGLNQRFAQSQKDYDNQIKEYVEDHLKIKDYEITYKEKVVGKILIPEPYPFGLFKTSDPSIKEFIESELLSNNTKLKIINNLYT